MNVLIFFMILWGVFCLLDAGKSYYIGDTQTGEDQSAIGAFLLVISLLVLSL